MKRYTKYYFVLLAAMLSLPVWAVTQATPQENITELTPQEVSSGNWRHTGDLALSNQPGTAEELISEARKQISLKGGRYYQITRLQLMENSSWSVNVALYSPAEKRIN